MKLSARRYFPRTPEGARLACEVAVQFAQMWFCGTDLDEVESTIGQGLYDAVYDGTGHVIILSYGKIVDGMGADGMAIEIRDRGGNYTRYFKRFGRVTAARGA